MPRSRLKRIHVNQHVIRSNRATGAEEPPLRVKASGRNLPGMEVRIEGPAQVVYRPENPLACGARVWIETRSPLRIVGGEHDGLTLH